MKPQCEHPTQKDEGTMHLHRIWNERKPGLKFGLHN